MKNEVPINGRIAIIDDHEKEVAPLMRFLSKHLLPYVYINPSDERFFPEALENDIRILFLDLNLLGSQGLKDKQVESMLANVLARVISPNNFPYVIIYWSVQEREYGHVLEGLFEGKLKDIAPIACKPFIKSEFFSLGEDEEKETTLDLVEELTKVLSEDPIYGSVLLWENLIHESTDRVLDEVFNNDYSKQDWSNNADVILTSLGQAYTGKNYVDVSAEEKFKWAYLVMNALLEDTIESNLWNHQFLRGRSSQDKPERISPTEEVKSILNKKLLTTSVYSDICEPGSVFQVGAKDESIFSSILNWLLSLFKIKSSIRLKSPDILDSELKKQANKTLTEMKREIKGSWVKIGVVVTPSCDYAQKKKVFDRVIYGVLIKSSFKEYLNDGPSFFISPTFEYQKDNYVLALDFKYLTSKDLKNELGVKEADFLFKIRKQVLAELQAQLSFHINRQGILNLD